MTEDEFADLAIEIWLLPYHHQALVVAFLRLLLAQREEQEAALAIVEARE